MRKTTLLASAAALVAVLAAAGCGTGGLGDRKADATKGKELFIAKCAGCHVLADAGALGVAGPNLDHAFAEVRKQGFKESTIFEVVHKQIKYPTGRALKNDEEVHVNGPLPTVNMAADIVTGSDSDAVAAYVAKVAGLPVQGGGGGAAAATDGKAIFASAGCGSCHVLKAAGSNGAIGPNLDDTKPDKALVVNRVTNGKGAMPAFKASLKPAQIEAVADFVSENAGK